MKYLILISIIFLFVSCSQESSVVEPQTDDKPLKPFEVVLHGNNHTERIQTTRIEYIGDGFLYISDSLGCGEAWEISELNAFYIYSLP